MGWLIFQSHGANESSLPRLHRSWKTSHQRGGVSAIGINWPRKNIKLSTNMWFSDTLVLLMLYSKNIMTLAGQIPCASLGHAPPNLSYASYFRIIPAVFLDDRPRRFSFDGFFLWNCFNAATYNTDPLAIGFARNSSSLTYAPSKFKGWNLKMHPTSKRGNIDPHHPF